MNKVLIIGPGAYGLCLSEVLQNNRDNEISLLGNSIDRLKEIQNNSLELFGSKIKSVKNVYTDYNECFSIKYDLIIFAVPSDKLEGLVNEISHYIKYDVNVINTAKGMKNENEYWCDFFQKTNKHFQYSFLTGPSFANEVINKQKTICNLCTKNKKVFEQIDEIFKCEYFKLVHLNQIKVYEFISSMKNAIALCFGIINAITTSENTVNALFCKFMFELQEILKLRFKFTKYNILTYCALGDIMMCSFNKQSRNFSYGYDYVKLNKDELDNKYQNLTIEGKRTLNFVKEILSKYGKQNFILYKFVDFLIDNKINLEELISNY